MKVVVKYSLIAIGVVLVALNQSVAQNSIGLNIGLASYEGDLHCFEEPNMNSWNSSGLSIGLYGKRDFGKFFDARIAYQFINFKGDDQNFGNTTGHLNRNFSFDNNMHEVTMKLDFVPLKDSKLSPFLSVGAGIAFNNPNTVFDLSNKTDVQLSRITEDQINLKRIILAFPVGLGINVHITKQVSIGAELALRIPVSDYLDGVSASAFSQFNDYFGTGVINLNYSLSSPRSGTPNRIAKKDQSLAEQMINVHPPSGDPGEISPINTPIKTDNSSAQENIAQKNQENKLDVVETRSESNEYNSDVPSKEKYIDATPKLELDSDNDGLIDKLDECPLVFAKTANGCPKQPVTSGFDCDIDFGARTIQFETSFSKLSNEDKTKLNDAVSIMNACSNLRLSIEGHTDSRGSELVNQNLSEQRASAVKSYIISKGIDARRVKAFGFGENQPVANNQSEEGRSLNRRVVVSFMR